MSVPVDLSKLSDAVKNDVVKKNVYDKLVAKVNNIGTSRFVLEIKYDTDKSELENKIPDTSGLVIKTNYDAKIADIEGKIHDISNLAIKTALAAVENKIPSVSSLVEKTDYDTKYILNNHNHDKYITTPEINALAADYLVFQNYLVFQSIHRYFKITHIQHTSLWKSKGLSDKTITLYATSVNSLTPLIDHYSIKVRAKFNGSCL